MYNMRRKPATHATFIDHCQYQVVSTELGQALPENWHTQAREFTCFVSIGAAEAAAQKRADLNEKPFAVVDRTSGMIEFIAVPTKFFKDPLEA